MTGLYVASNPTALSSQFNLTRNMGELSSVLTRLSTGLRINSGKDDPAGLIASELLKSQITGTTKAITNTQRANSLISTADSGLSQVGNLLNDIKGLVVEAANTGAMSAEQIAANQLQVDASLDSIDRIARTTNFAGQKLLDGSLDFRTSGANNGYISNLKIDSANFGTADYIGVNVNVQQTASNATLFYQGTGVAQKTTLDITGNVGSKSLTFGAGATNADIALAINGASDSTGVNAFVEGLAERGSVILSTAGANNDIVITANKTGFDAGNYSFRITQGTTNDARIVTEAAGGKPGVVEITLAPATQHEYKDFAGLFNITVDTTNNTAPTTAPTSVSMTRGSANSAVYHETASAAIARTGNGKSITAAYGTSQTARMSELNGWTVIVDDTVDATAGAIDTDNKTVRINSATDAAGLGDILNQALAGTSVSDEGTPDFEFTFAGEALVNGDTLTFKDGANAGEVAITYKEGATANDILKLLNSAPNVQATLAQDVDGTALIKALPDGKTYVSAGDGTATVNTVSQYTSGATAQDVIDLINSKLGDKFMATAMSGDSGTGRVSYMDAAVDYGSVNLDNALRFTGMDNGPVVRITNMGADNKPIANQKLGVKIIQPSEDDIKAGIHTPILEIRLATDGSGNSITTAKDIADLFDRLTADETLGVSAEVLYPPGVDPNGRIFGVDSCNDPIVTETCPAPYGLGIVQPTNQPGPCTVAQGDLVLLGTNQSLTSDFAIARIASGTQISGSAAESDGTVGGGLAELTFGNTSAMNGLTFGFTRDETMEGFDETTGKLTIFLQPEIVDGSDADATAAVDGAIAANWEAIRAYTGATGNAVKLAANVTAADAIADAGTGATTSIPATSVAGGDGDRGVGTDDPALIIKATEKGTDMAGVNIYFVNDPTRTDLATYTYDSATPTAMPEIDVKYVENEDGSRSLIVTGNIGTGSLVGTVGLASALNSNTTFKTHFKAEASLASDDTAIGQVEFAKDVTKPVAQTVGGYRVDSPAISGSNQTGTSSGIGMTGQADSNERLILQAAESGSANFVKVYVAQGSFDTYDPYNNRTSYATGSDMIATINGNLANASGNNISINTPDLALSMNVANVLGLSGFTIDGGGALFQLGPDVVSTQQMRLGIGSMMTTRLGGASGQIFQLKSGGTADLRTSDASRKLADKIVNEAISTVATTRGRLGAIQKASLEPNINSLQDSLTALTESEAQISNADFAQESSNLTRLQLLIQAGAQTLGIANQLPQYAASLVR
jgi:flagellin-like hook-associated protein FlgL